MIETVYYSIKPRSALLDLFEQYPPAHLLFRQPVIWVHEEGGFGSPNADEYSLGIKLLFLAEFRSNYIRLQFSNKENLLEAIMGHPPFNVGIFDKWWELERFQLSSKFAGVVFRIHQEQLNLFEETGIAKVDNWIANIKKLKAELKAEGKT